MGARASYDHGVARQTKYVVALDEATRRKLARIRQDTTRPERTRQRAKLILLADDGLTNTEIGRRIGMKADYVGTWRKRFVQEGIAGLEDRKRTGRPRTRPREPQEVETTVTLNGNGSQRQVELRIKVEVVLPEE